MYFSHFQKSLPPPHCLLSTIVETPIPGVLEIVINDPKHEEMTPTNDLGTLILVIQIPYSLMENFRPLSLVMVE